MTSLLLYLYAWLSVFSSYTSTRLPMHTVRRLAVVPRHIACTLPQPSVMSKGSGSGWELAAAAYTSPYSGRLQLQKLHLV
jgi:hypothetical protein